MYGIYGYHIILVKEKVMSFNKEHFENEEIWNYSEFQKQINKEKYRYIKNALDFDLINSIIDIGCGNGNMLSNYIDDCTNLTGADYSKTALNYVNEFAKVIYLDLEDPQIEDFKRYDLVMSYDVLEHLRSDALQNAVNLIKNISKKYIVINVPNNEDLEHRRAKCHHCHTVYHPYGHINSFDLNNIIELFSDKNIKYITSTTLGPIKSYHNFYLAGFSKHILENYMNIDTATCPACNSTITTSQRNILSKFPNALNKLIGLTQKKEREELVVIFEVV